MTLDACFQIAYVTKTHGLKGEITLSLSPDCPNLTTAGSVFLQIKGQLVPYLVEAVSLKGTRAYVKLENISTAEAADALTGAAVYLPKAQRPELPRGQFYSDEVAGFEVVDSTIGSLGLVKEVLEMGLNRQLIVDRGGREVLIPINGPFIKGINKARKQLRVELPEGFLDL